jgi:hypothetical protein
MALTIYGKKTSGVIEVGVMAYRREYVEDLSLIGVSQELSIIIRQSVVIKTSIDC